VALKAKYDPDNQLFIAVAPDPLLREGGS